MEKVYDVVIIGAGPAGLASALYTSRSGLNTLIIERGLSGGQLQNTEMIENYPGSGAIGGPALAQKMEDDALAFGAEKVWGDVDRIEIDGGYKVVKSGSKEYTTKTVIIGTGTRNRKLGIPGEQGFTGRGVSYCAVCDGAFFKNKELVVIGGGDSAVEEGMYLTQFANKVTIIYRGDTLRAQQLLQDRMSSNEKMNVIWNTVVEEIHGDEKMTNVTLRNDEGNIITFEADGAFIYIGLLPNTESFENLGITNDSGFIETDGFMRTKIPGVFAIGDVRETPLRQVATAVSDGAIAGNEVYKYLSK